jgi:hypothetical protein
MPGVVEYTLPVEFIQAVTGPVIVGTGKALTVVAVDNVAKAAVHPLLV